jgi:hypothetical protein
MKMYVKEAAYDEWSDLLVKEHVITAPNWEEIEWIILKLDSNTHTSLTYSVGLKRGLDFGHLRTTKAMRRANGPPRRRSAGAIISLFDA